MLAEFIRSYADAPEVRAQLATLALSNLQQSRATIEQLPISGFEHAAAAAHTIANSLAVLKLPELARHMNRIEQTARSAELAQLRQYYDTIGPELDAVALALEQLTTQAG